MNPKAWMLLSAAALATTLLTGPGCGSGASDAQTEDPDGMNPYPSVRGGEVKGEKNFATLINKYPQGTGNLGWAAFWWPYTSNGIASGEYGGGSSRGGGHSPAGKYDAARGQNRAQDWEVHNHGAGVPKVQGWWGHCNGWCAASSLLPEPREAVTVNGIEFGVADLKALISEAGMAVDADFYGNRVDAWNSDDGRRWEDTVPDQFFLVLTNYMGKAGRTVLIDRYSGDQVWNQPLAGYRFQYPTQADYLGCSGGICKINIQATLWWYNDSGVPAHVITPPFEWQDQIEPNTGSETVQHRDLAMELWLDAPVVFGPDGKIASSGDVVVTHTEQFFAGGAWKVGTYNVDGNPDYMWIPYSFTQPDPNDDYANPYVDAEWIKAHLLVPGGRDDNSVRPNPIVTAPAPRPSGGPTHTPTSTPTSGPGPGPTWQPPVPTWVPTSPPLPDPVPTSPLPPFPGPPQPQPTH